jgi:hypothetical protein
MGQVFDDYRRVTNELVRVNGLLERAGGDIAAMNRGNTNCHFGEPTCNCALDTSVIDTEAQRFERFARATPGWSSDKFWSDRSLLYSVDLNFTRARDVANAWNDGKVKMPPPVAAAVPPKIEQPTIPPAAVPAAVQAAVQAAVDAFRKAVVYAALGKVPQKDPDFPGVCPRCGGQAYVGATSVDCKAKCSP